MKIIEKLEARRLRQKEGLPLNEIAQRLGVSKSSVSLWVRDIELSEDQQRVLITKNPIYSNQNSGGRARSAITEEFRRKAQEQGQIDASKNDLLHAMGCMLFWAEGAKCRASVIFANTDEHMLRLFKKFLRSMEVQDSDIRCQINVHLGNGLTVEQVELWWSKQLCLSRNCFTKTTISKLGRMSSGVKKNKHPYGVCSLKVHNVELTQRIFGAVRAYADIEQEKWIK